MKEFVKTAYEQQYQHIRYRFMILSSNATWEIQNGFRLSNERHIYLRHLKKYFSPMSRTHESS